MTERYEPKSDFLNSILAHDVPLTGSPFAEANLRLLVEMTRDPEPSNRDWATFLLAQTQIDRPEFRDLFFSIAGNEKEEDYIRAEAVRGLAQLDASLALPFVQEALRSGEIVSSPTLEAAELCAHPSLIDDLREWTDVTDDRYFNFLVGHALTACEKAVSSDEGGTGSDYSGSTA